MAGAEADATRRRIILERIHLSHVRKNGAAWALLPRKHRLTRAAGVVFTAEGRAFPAE